MQKVKEKRQVQRQGDMEKVQFYMQKMPRYIPLRLIISNYLIETANEQFHWLKNSNKILTIFLYTMFCLAHCLPNLKDDKL